ncbi:hypothetical protein DPMN_012352 [Dreissena polymorpha]|uniref:Uncharacterized protein n=1 Tax=Dreissena polymorpha TaxID=45954 RepID=A0A9D4N3A2_DREPO|nr:hypothetical protein DPMN_012352 [Dreissena polymorpha]
MNACGKLAASLRQARRKLAKLNFTLYKLAASLLRFKVAGYCVLEFFTKFLCCWNTTEQHKRSYHRMGGKGETATAEQHKSRQCTNQHQYSLHTV